MQISFNAEIPLGKWLRELRFLIPALAFCSLCQVCDVVSSMGATPGSGFVEANPFARHDDGSFWLLHGIVNKIVNIALFGLLSAILYYSIKPADKRAATVAACVPFIYFGVECLIAAVDNWMLLGGLARF